MIHYHGMSGAGTTEDMVSLSKGRHCFVSYAAHGKLPLFASVCSSFALDNGAFTAWKKGESFDMSGFIAFVSDWMNHPAFDWAVMPDIIDGSEEENDALLEEWTLPKHIGVPVYHMHESFERLERLIENYDYICLGSSGQYSQPNSKIWWGRMNQIMDIVTDDKGQPRVRMHGLRMLNPKVFTRLPLKSADSTNAERNGLLVERFGMYPPPTRGQRAVVIADRVESDQSASTWIRDDQLKLQI
jgi:hypothetical protein